MLRNARKGPKFTKQKDQMGWNRSISLEAILSRFKRNSSREHRCISLGARLELASSEIASKILGFPFEGSLQARKSRFKRSFIWAAQNLSGLTPFSHQNSIFKSPIRQNKFHEVFMDQNSFNTLKQT